MLPDTSIRSALAASGREKRILLPSGEVGVWGCLARGDVELCIPHLGERVAYAQYIKMYAQTEEGRRRYSPPKVISTEKKDIYGDPDQDRICTSHIERQNGSLRQWCKRFTRLTYAFSKNWQNLRAALALHFAYCNFCRVHRSIKMTPAMASGLTDHAWSLAELLQSVVRLEVAA